MRGEPIGDLEADETRRWQWLVSETITFDFVIQLGVRVEDTQVFHKGRKLHCASLLLVKLLENLPWRTKIS